MSTTPKVILVSVWFAVWLTFVALTIWDRMTEWTYNARMAPGWKSFLMPGRLSDKEVWVRFQRRMAWFALFFGAFVYVLALASVFSHR